jgi:hypothetical protein
MKKILYINSFDNDYLADSILIGLKQLEIKYNIEIFELPINNFIYHDSKIKGNHVHGNGFTLSNIINSK